jgi:hypothetical protein
MYSRDEEAASHRRQKAISDWYREAIGCADVYLQYFSLYVALIVASDVERQASESDAELISRYLRKRAPTVVAALRKNEGILTWMALRRGTGSGEAMIDIPFGRRGFWDERRATSDRNAIDGLAAAWSGGQALSNREEARAFAVLLRRVRNNLFHGDKGSRDGSDIDLLECLNVLLSGVLKATELSRTP